jgi:hypothetical protein
MANILVDKFTYKSYTNYDTPTVEIYVGNIFVKKLEYSSVTFTQQSALDSAKSNTEIFGVLGEGNMDFYELRPLPEASTTPPIKSSPTTSSITPKETTTTSTTPIYILGIKNPTTPNTTNYSQKITFKVSGPFKQAFSVYPPEAPGTLAGTTIEGNRSSSSFDDLVKSLIININNAFNGEGTSAEVIIIEKQLPEPVIPTPTPAETNAKREEKDTKDSETQEINKTELEVSAQPTPTPDDGPKGQEKIALLIIKKAQDLVTLLIPIIITTATKIGIKALGKAKEKLPDTCLPQKELKKILDIRNKLIDQLNNVNATINILTKPIDTLVEIVDANEKILTGLNVAKLALQIAIPLVPTSPPGLPDLANPSIIAVTAIPDIEDFLKNNITSIKNPIYSLKKSKDHVNIIFLKLINLLKSLDKYLIGCGIKNELIPLSPSLQALDETQNQQILDAQNVNAVDFPSSVYKGFTLDIVKEPFSPTVNRVKAVAKNPQGIILLQTPLSFTTTPQILISNIKLIIDLNPNLKAQ